MLDLEETNLLTLHAFENTASSLEKISILFDVWNQNDERGSLVIYTTIELSKLDKKSKNENLSLHNNIETNLLNIFRKIS